MGTSEKLYRILVVEDNPTDADLIAEALSVNGVVHAMVVLNDGQKALEHLKDIGKEKPDLVILDLNIPKHGGLEVLVRYRSNAELFSVPMIVLTSSDSPGDKQRSRTIGVSAFLRKPLNLDEFLELGKQFKAILETPYIYTGPRHL